MYMYIYIYIYIHIHMFYYTDIAARHQVMSGCDSGVHLCVYASAAQ